MQHTVRQAGHVAVPVDVAQGGAAHDLTDANARAALIASIAAGEYDAVFASPPCKSFSVRHPKQLRSKARPRGVEPMPAEWAEFVLRHNIMADFAATAVAVAAAAGIPAGIEHPADRGDDDSLAHWPKHADRGTIWDLEGQLLATARAELSTFPQCAACMGGSAQKWTTIAAAGGLERHMQPFSGLACHHADHAEVLAGLDAGGKYKSAAASAYPPGMARLLTHALITAAIATRGSLDRFAAGEPAAPQRALGPEGRVADGPGLGPRAAAACEAARNIHLPFASPHLLSAAPPAELRREPFGGNLHDAQAEPPRARRSKALRRRPLPGMSGEAADRGGRSRSNEPQQLPAATTARIAAGPITIEELFLPGVYAEEVDTWFALCDAAVQALHAGRRPPRVPTRVIGQEQMATWARGVVWDCRDPRACRPLQPSTRDTTFPEEPHPTHPHSGQRPDGEPARQIDRPAFRRVAANLGWDEIDADIVDQACEGGIEARADCELATVLTFHHESLANELAAAEQSVQEQIGEGWVQPPRRFLPIVPARLQPRGVVMQSKTKIIDGKPVEVDKPRIITDSSYGGPDSANAGVPDGERALRLPSNQSYGRGWAVVASAFDGQPASDGGGVDVDGYVVDAEKAYSFCPVQRRDWWLQCFVWWDANGRTGVAIDERMQFGGCFGPNRFERVSTIVIARADQLQRAVDEAQPPPPCAQRWAADRRELQRRGELPPGRGQTEPRFIQSFIDDCCGAAPRDIISTPSYLSHINVPLDHMRAVGCTPPPVDSRVMVHAKITIYAAEEVGLSTPHEKVMVGSPVTALGLSYDGRERIMRCPTVKRAGVLAACEALRAAAQPAGGARPSVERAAARRLTGRLCNLSQVAPTLADALHGGYSVADPRGGQAHATVAGLRELPLREGSPAQVDWIALLDAAETVIGTNQGVPMAPKRHIEGRGASGSLTSVTDASGDDGFGGYAFLADQPGTVFIMSEEWRAETRVALAASASEGEAARRRDGDPSAAPFFAMPAAELATCILLPRAVGRIASVRRVFAVGDCQPAAAVLRSLRGRGAQMQRLAAAAREETWAWLGVHITRDGNLDADRLSHPAQLEAVVADAEAAGLRVVRVRPNEADWAILAEAIAASACAARRKRKRR